MKYNRAAEVLPDDLVFKIQDYVEGCLIYIPNRMGWRRSWGESTKTREMIQDRNLHILVDYRSGLSAGKIALKYHLAESTVRKIIYRK